MSVFLIIQLEAIRDVYLTVWDWLVYGKVHIYSPWIMSVHFYIVTESIVVSVMAVATSFYLALWNICFSSTCKSQYTSRYC